jgi:RimJ/RimL family protein N-acetyltransferase
MIILETKRLVLRHLNPETDAEFILRLLNEPSFLQYIGDKGIRTIEDARQYITNGPARSYQENGFGLYCVGLKDLGEPIGISGIIRRDTLPDPDIGFAFLPEYWNQGYAYESATAVMKYARAELQLERILAITTPENEASAKLLGKIGLRFDRLVKLADDAPNVKLFTSEA